MSWEFWPLPGPRPGEEKRPEEPKPQLQRISFYEELAEVDSLR